MAGLACGVGGGLAHADDLDDGPGVAVGQLPPGPVWQNDGGWRLGSLPADSNPAGTQG
ncbi:hypothetical protein [Nocardia terpenica]|uniref:Uncharacterized protein n=1 Tax=Nocardia terpenica TaxID=455432 RepID=A0A6G9ZDC5_9NOCA|nr:hypothetical protein [Nocardia terpenica]QIS23619.1 hypothetical protein F6W96_40485 [Nocardia terpenica]